MVRLLFHSCVLALFISAFILLYYSVDPNVNKTQMLNAGEKRESKRSLYVSVWLTYFLLIYFTIYSAYFYYYL